MGRWSPHDVSWIRGSCSGRFQNLGGGGLRNAETHAQQGVAHSDHDGMGKWAVPGPGPRKEPSLSLTQQLSVISGIISPLQLAEAFPRGLLSSAAS